LTLRSGKIPDGASVDQTCLQAISCKVEIGPKLPEADAQSLQFQHFGPSEADALGFVVAMGDPGSLSLFGRDENAHRLLAEHFAAEYRVRTTARDRVVDEKKLRANRPDNHWLDCLVGCAVAASIQGAVVFGTEVTGTARRERVSFAELQRKKRR
jgi:hypothetical protein